MATAHARTSERQVAALPLDAVILFSCCGELADKQRLRCGTRMGKNLSKSKVKPQRSTEQDTIPSRNTFFF